MWNVQTVQTALLAIISAMLVHLFSEVHMLVGRVEQLTELSNALAQLVMTLSQKVQEAHAVPTPPSCAPSTGECA